MSSPDHSIFKKLAQIRRHANLRLSVEQLMRLDYLKQGQYTAAIVEEEETCPPRFLTDIQNVEVFVDEGEPAMFECRVEPKHDLNLSVAWFHDGEELVSGGRMKITHEFGHVTLHIFYTYPEDEGVYTCRATNELGEDETSATLTCRPLPHLKFNTPSFDTDDKEEQVSLIQEAAKRHGMMPKLRGDEIYREDGPQYPPRFIFKLDNFPKVLAGQSVNLQTFVVPVGDPAMKVEWFLNDEPLLFKSSYSPIYDHGYLGLNISKVYPDDFGELKVVVTNGAGSSELISWVGEWNDTLDSGNQQAEPDLPAWCNKVEKGRLAIDCPPEITKHLVDIEVGETETVKLEVNHIGNPRPEVIWTRNGEELSNSRHVQIREREGKTTLVLINITAAMGGEYRMVVVSPLGSDMTFCRLSVVPLDKESLAKIRKMEEDGLRQLVLFEEKRLVEKKRKKMEKEERLRVTKEKAKSKV